MDDNYFLLTPDYGDLVDPSLLTLGAFNFDATGDLLLGGGGGGGGDLGDAVGMSSGSSVDLSSDDAASTFSYDSPLPPGGLELGVGDGWLGGAGGAGGAGASAASAAAAAAAAAAAVSGAGQEQAQYGAVQQEPLFRDVQPVQQQQQQQQPQQGSAAEVLREAAAAAATASQAEVVSGQSSSSVQFGSAEKPWVEQLQKKKNGKEPFDKRRRMVHLTVRTSNPDLLGNFRREHSSGSNPRTVSGGLSLEVRIQRRPFDYTDLQYREWMQKYQKADWFMPCFSYFYCEPAASSPASGNERVLELSLNETTAGHAIFKQNTHPQYTKCNEYLMVATLCENGVVTATTSARFKTIGRKRSKKRNRDNPVQVVVDQVPHMERVARTVLSSDEPRAKRASSNIAKRIQQHANAVAEGAASPETMPFDVASPVSTGSSSSALSPVSSVDEEGDFYMSATQLLTSADAMRNSFVGDDFMGDTFAPSFASFMTHSVNMMQGLRDDPVALQHLQQNYNDDRSVQQMRGMYNVAMGMNALQDYMHDGHRGASESHEAEDTYILSRELVTAYFNCLEWLIDELSPKE